MPLSAYQLLQMLNETKKGSVPDSEPEKSVTPTAPTCGIICFSTSNFDAMKKFLVAMSFVVTEGSDQLLPLFSAGRGARVKRGDFEFNLEEDTAKPCAASFNMMMTDLSETEINQAKCSGFKFTHAASPYGEFYTFVSPDGGSFIIT